MDHSIISHREWLLNENETSLQGRLMRLDYIVREYGIEDGIQVFPGGLLSKRHFEEARWNFVNGQFIGCVLLCQCFLESSLRGLIILLGSKSGVDEEWIEKVGFYELIIHSLQMRIISEKQAAEFHWIRITRSKYVHPKPVYSKKSFMVRVLNEKLSSEAIFYKDAKRAIKIVLQLIKNPPFAF